MNLLAYASPCQACLSRSSTIKFCAARCEPDGPGEFSTASRIGDAPVPHFHATCQNCGYVWLEKTLGFPDAAEATS